MLELELWLLRLVMNFMDAFLSPDLSETGPAADLYRTTFWIGGALTVVLALRRLGVVDGLTHWLAPGLQSLGISPALILPTVTKYMAGGTAAMGVMDEMLRAGTMTPETLNGPPAGFLISPLDLPGLAIFMSAGPRIAQVWKPALLGGMAGILVRTLGHALWS